MLSSLALVLRADRQLGRPLWLLYLRVITASLPRCPTALTVLGCIAIELDRLRMQAAAIGDGLLAVML